MITKEHKRAVHRAWKAKNRERVQELNRASYRRRKALDPAKFCGYTNKLATERRELIKRLKAKPCADCGVQYPHYVMDFDHRDPAIKLFTIGPKKTCQIDRLLAEIAKCDLVCANCHRERTQRRIDSSRGPRRAAA